MIFVLAFGAIRLYVTGRPFVVYEGVKRYEENFPLCMVLRDQRNLR